MIETPNPHIVDVETMTGQVRPIRRAVLSLGSNLGERLASLQGAVNSLADTPEVSVIGVSPVYETDPVDAPEGSRDFLNAVIVVDTTLRARTLLDRAQAIEDAFGRERGQATERNAPRTLELARGIVLRVPARLAQIALPQAIQVAELFPEGRVSGECLEPLTRDVLQECPGVARALPHLGVDHSPQVVARVTPRPAKIQSELGQHRELIRQIGTEGDACHLGVPSARSAPVRSARTSMLPDELTSGNQRDHAPAPGVRVPQT